MDAVQVSRMLLERAGVRIEPHMAQYVTDKLQLDPEGAIPVMGCDARTGAPIRRVVSFKELATGQ